MECSSATGLGKINDLRKLAGLSEITPPWHNIYLDDARMAEASIDQCELVDVDSYSATYYFLSRVVNAWLAAQTGYEPRYDAPVNKLAQLLPAMGDHAQGKIWVFEKRG
jgi:hypothetical protein